MKGLGLSSLGLGFGDFGIMDLWFRGLITLQC